MAPLILTIAWVVAAGIAGEAIDRGESWYRFRRYTLLGVVVAVGVVSSNLALYTYTG